MASAKFIQPGETIDFTPKTAVVANDVVVIGSRVGIAGSNIDAGATGAAIVEGVFEVPKKASTAITAGAEVYFSATAGTASTTNTDTDMGYAVADASADATTVKVKLRG
jgi:predicted RecA/RadA family phage recombinase